MPIARTPAVDNLEWPISLVDSGWFGSEYEGRAGLSEARAIGFDAVDLFIGYDPADLDPTARRTLLETAHESGLRVSSLFCTALGLSDFNPSVAKYHVERTKRVIDLAAEFTDPTSIMLCPGEYLFGGRLLPADEEWHRLVLATRRIASHAGERQLDVAVELLPFEHALISSLDDMERLFADVDLPNLKAAVDISHLWLMRIPPEEVKRLAGRIAQVHIADCDGEVHGDLPPGRGNTPLHAYLSAIAATGYSGTVSVELEFPQDPRQILAWVEEAFQATQALLASVNQTAERERPEATT
jgi:sugar phosphate isomerase/epimerase